MTSSEVSKDRAVAVVTGSAVGIGRAICVALGRRGICVVGLDIDTARNDETAALVGESMIALTCDVGDAAAVKVAIDGVVAQTSRVDVLVNNAAVFNNNKLLDGAYEQQVAAFHRAMDACAMGSFHCAAAVAPTMTDGGLIVNLITEHIRPNAYISGTQATGYDCAKFAQWRLTESWAIELAPRNIRVNGLAFGATDTPMLRAVSARVADNAMHTDDVVDAFLAVLECGTMSRSGEVYDFGFTGTPRETSREQIAALRAQLAG